MAKNQDRDGSLHARQRLPCVTQVAFRDSNNTSTHLVLANFSCHFPRATGLAVSPVVSATSSTLSWMVEMAFSSVAVGWSESSPVEDDDGAGARRIRALDVFFWRRPQVWLPCLTTADAVDDSSFKLCIEVNLRDIVVRAPDRAWTYTGGSSDSSRASSSGGSSRSL